MLGLPIHMVGIVTVPRRRAELSRPTETPPSQMPVSTVPSFRSSVRRNAALVRLAVIQPLEVGGAILGDGIERR